MVIPSLAEAAKAYESLSPAALIEADNVCPQLMGVWARTMRGNVRITLRIKVKIGSLDSNLIFNPSIPDACLSLEATKFQESPPSSIN
jgi:hypothetical protein